MKRKKKMVLKILRFRENTIFSKLRVVKYYIKSIEKYKKIEDGYTYKIRYKNGLNWLNPLTYLSIIGLFIVGIGNSIIGTLSEFKSGDEYIDYIKIKDEEINDQSY